MRCLKRSASGFIGSVKRVRIARVDVFGYGLRYAHGEYVMSGGRSVASLPSTLVRVTSDSGLEGWGETCPLGPTYLEAHADGARAALRVLAPALLGVDASNLHAVQDAMDGALRGHAYAKSALDIACWDLLGQALGVPVSTLLGGVRSPDFPLYVAIPLGPAEAMVQHVRDRRAEGVRHFQLKLGADPREDAARVRAVLEEDLDVVVADANGGWRLQDAVIAARALEGLDRVLFEQPCPTLEECLVVRERTTLPMVLDEVITDVQAPDPRVRGDGGDQPEDRPGRRAHQGAADPRPRHRARAAVHDRGQLGRRRHHRGRQPPRRLDAPDHLLMASFMNDWTLDHVAGYDAPFGARSRRRAHQPRDSDSRSIPSASALRLESAVWSP